MAFTVKILNIISQRPDSTGSGIYLQEVMAQAQTDGHHNYLVCGLDQEGPAPLPGIEPAHIHPVRFGTSENPEPIVGMSDVMPYPSRTFRELETAEIDHYLKRFSQMISSALKAHDLDLIHCHHLWLIGSILKDLAPETPVSLSCHGSDLRQFDQCPHLRDRVRRGCRQADRIFCLSRAQKDEISELYGIKRSRIAVVGAGYNQKIFNTGSRSPERRRPCTITYAGKMSRAKGVVWLIRALQTFSDAPFHLHLAGSGQGPEYRQCLDEAAQLGSRVTVHGPLGQTELARLMRDSDLFVLPSLYEGLPLVVLEALGCGCRVIATDLPGCREIEARLSNSDLILIPAPSVIDTAATRIEDEAAFITNLTGALSPFLADCSHAATPKESVSGLDYFNWNSVYRRMHVIWLDMLSSSRHL
jgi:glycosyltransferase involved in cell wall biosynthesis